MTGIRSWAAEVTAFGVVVSIEHDFIQLPLGSFHLSHNPAMAAKFLMCSASRRAVTPVIAGTWPGSISAH